MEKVGVVWCGPKNHAVVYWLCSGDVLNFVGIPERDAWEEESWSQRRPSFIRVAVFRSRPHRKSRHLVEKKIEAMVVVDDYCHIGLRFFQPRLHRAETVEEGLPVRFVLAMLCDGAAN